MSYPHAPLPEGIVLGEDHATPAVLVSTPAATAVVHLDGAHVTSWVPAGQDEVLWLSPQARFGEGESIRGGIPLVGPWFGPGREGTARPAHGWLRSHRWRLEAAERIGDGVSLVLGLTGADPSGQGISARLFLGIAERLTVELTVRAGALPLDLEAALHTYLAVADARRVDVTGLDGAALLDNTQDLRPGIQEGPITFSGRTVDLVLEATGPVNVHDPASGRTLRSTPRDSTRTVVWNPGPDGAAALGDMPAEDWSRFVCVETAVAKDGFVALAPGQSHCLSASYEVLPEGSA